MRIYLDDNHSGGKLAKVLTGGGNEVVQPIHVGLLGASDAVHLEHAIRQSLVVLTADGDDFHDLHQLLQTARGAHPGILVIHFDDNPKHDMKPGHVAAAVRKLEKSGVVWENDIIILNQWR